MEVIQSDIVPGYGEWGGGQTYGYGGMVTVCRMALIRATHDALLRALTFCSIAISIKSHAECIFLNLAP